MHSIYAFYTNPVNTTNTIRSKVRNQTVSVIPPSPGDTSQDQVEHSSTPIISGDDISGNSSSDPSDEEYFDSSQFPLTELTIPAATKDDCDEEEDQKPPEHLGDDNNDDDNDDDNNPSTPSPVTRPPSIDPDTAPYTVTPNFVNMIRVAVVSNQRMDNLRLQYYGEDARYVRRYKRSCTPTRFRRRAEKRHGNRTFEMWRMDIGRIPGDDYNNDDINDRENQGIWGIAGLREATSSMDNSTVSRSRTPDDESQLQREFQEEVFQEWRNSQRTQISMDQSGTEEDTIGQNDEEITSISSISSPSPLAERVTTRTRQRARTNTNTNTNTNTIETVRRSARVQVQRQRAASSSRGNISQSQYQNRSRRGRKPKKQQQQQQQQIQNSENLRRSPRNRKPPNRFLP